MLIKMSAEITKELERLSLEIDEIKKLSHSGLKTLSPEIKLKKYHALLNILLFPLSIKAWRNGKIGTICMSKPE